MVPINCLSVFFCYALPSYHLRAIRGERAHHACIPASHYATAIYRWMRYLLELSCHERGHSHNCVDSKPMISRVQRHRLLAITQNEFATGMMAYTIYLANQIMRLLFGELLAPIRGQRFDDGVYLDMPWGRRALEYLLAVDAERT